MNGRLKGILVLAAIIGAGYATSQAGNEIPAVPSTARAPDETYRLVHAIGNSETINARGLTRSECDARKKESATVAETVGVGGSITCLPESLFK